MPRALLGAFLLTLTAAACAADGGTVAPGRLASGEIVLPNGRLLTPAGIQTAVASYPFGMAATRDGRRVVVASTGVADQALQLLDGKSGRLLFSLPVSKSWLGLALSPDGERAYLAGANDDVVRVFTLKDDRIAHAGELPVATDGDGGKDPIPSGVAVSADGGVLWVTRILADDVVRIDVAARKATAVIGVGRHPYRPVLSPDGKLLAVSNWASESVSLLDPIEGRALATIVTDEHPSDLVFSPDGMRLYVAQGNRNRVAVIDVPARRVVRQISVAMGPSGPGTPSAETLPDGSTPNALAVTRDGKTLYVANADDDAVAVVDVSGRAATARAVGFIPAGWYPDALALSADGKTLIVANAKGSGSRPNAKEGPNPTRPEQIHQRAKGFVGYLPGSVSFVPLPGKKELSRLTVRAYANRKPRARGEAPNRPSRAVPEDGGVSPIRHVFYVIRENRTYDQVLGDEPRGNGDASLTLFGREVTPNAHALAEEFVLFDNFYADAEVSADGHNWSTAAYATDFTEKTWVPFYGGMGFDYLWEGYDSAAAPSAGYLWDAAARAGLSLRNYGEFVGVTPERLEGRFNGRTEATVDNLKGNTCPFYPGFDPDFLDNARVDLFLKEFRDMLERSQVPRLSLIRLGNDHTVGTKSGGRTPRAMVADNDLALGRLVEAISRSLIWKESAIFVVEDDAQNGSDHVDAHRTLAFVISPYTRTGKVDSTLYSTTSMLRTMELILGLPPLSQHDASATPMTNAFADTADAAAIRPYTHRPANIPLYEMNPPDAPMQAEADGWDFSREDAAPDLALNQAIWKSVRGRDAVMPAPVNAAFVTESRESRGVDSQESTVDSRE